VVEECIASLTLTWQGIVFQMTRAQILDIEAPIKEGIRGIEAGVLQIPGRERQPILHEALMPTRV
jgi:hypothetical protein